jgi:predicted transcriptional regulator
MRTKKRPTVATANITDAWAKVFEDSKVEDIEDLRRQGWRHVYELAESCGRDRQYMQRKLESEVTAGRFECKRTKVFRKNQVRELLFFRPKG